MRITWLPIVLLAALALAPGAALAAPKPTQESYAALQKQIASGNVKKATVSPPKHTVKVKLANGRTYAATFTASAQPALVASLRAKGAKVHVDKKKKSGHIRYRYIALIALAAIALAGGMYYLLRGRRRNRPHSPTVITPGPSAGG
jgi:ATP-dependent Zn protease